MQSFIVRLGANRGDELCLIFISTLATLHKVPKGEQEHLLFPKPSSPKIEIQNVVFDSLFLISNQRCF